MSNEPPVEPPTGPAPQMPFAPLPSARNRFGNEAIAPYFFVVVFIVAFLGVGYILLPFLGDMVIALLFVILLTPLHARLTRVLKGRAALAAGLMVTGLVAVGGFPIFLISSALLRDISEAANTWSHSGKSLALRTIAGDGAMMHSITGLAGRIGLRLSEGWAERAMMDSGKALTQWLATRANHFLSGFFSTILHTIITLFATFYLFIHGEKFRVFLFRLSPLKDDEDQLFINKLGEVGRAILIGNGTSSLLQGIGASIVWLLVGLPSPVLWGLLMAVAAFLPLVGIAAVVVPATIFLWVEGRPSAALVLFALAMGQSFFFEYWLKPRLMGKSMSMNSLLVFLSLLGGILGFGAPGLLYGPLIMTLFLALVQLYQTRYQERIASRLASLHGEAVDGP
jgi:predicted PurR-regulated permease PerM